MANASLLMVPNPDGSGRWCVYDPITRAYLPGGVNVSEKVARDLVGFHQVGDWQPLAIKAGWIPPASKVVVPGARTNDSDVRRTEQPAKKVHSGDLRRGADL